jgi:hypothetical protein
MSMRSVNGDVALPSAARGTGTHTSSSIDSGPGVSDILVMVHVTAASGTTPTLAVSIEQSNDGSSWAAVTGGATAVNLTAAGNATINAAIPQRFVRVVATVGGTTPSFTFRVAALVFAE